MTRAAPRSNEPLDRIIRMPELVQITGLSAASVYRAIAQGRFPRPVALSAQARGWRVSDVQSWLDGLGPVDVAPNSEGG